MNVGADIIAALATAPGPSAIAVVRISGTGAHALTMKLCRDLKEMPPPRRLTLTWIVHPESGTLLDQALVAFYPPHSSYTGEEAAEIFCHGGKITPLRILGACVAAGARQAKPGEFTRRALASGKMDLIQAEALALLAEAESDAAADVALRALSGQPSQEVLSIRERLLDLLADCEAALDFAEEDGVEVSFESVISALRETVAEMNEWLENAKAARSLLTGVRIVLAGPPNAGKSSLFNVLLGKERTIVHPDPGTTRDVVSEPMVLGGVQCVLVDTAGLRRTTSPVEHEGVVRAMREIEESDIVILALDGTLEYDLSQFPRYDVLVATKKDLWCGCAPRFSPQGGLFCATSVVTGEGIRDLRELLRTLATKRYETGKNARTVVAGERQIITTLAARDCLAASLRALLAQEPLEVVASYLREAVEHLGELTGAKITEEVLERIFSRFCIGK